MILENDVYTWHVNILALHLVLQPGLEISGRF